MLKVVSAKKYLVSRDKPNRKFPVYRIPSFSIGGYQRPQATGNRTSAIMASSLSAPQSSLPAAARRQSPARDNAEDLVTYCCVCFLPAASARTGEGDDTEGNPPFWLTSCGHIVCGSHVFPDGGMDTNKQITRKRLAKLS